MSFIRSSSPGLALSAFKKAERSNAVILRIYNPSPKAVDANIDFFKKIKSAVVVNLNEEPLRGEKNVKIKGASLKLSLGSKKIRTVRLAFSR